MAVLRLLHIVFGVFWAGSAFFMAVLLEPRLRTLGPPIQRPVMQALVPVLLPAMIGSSLITLLAGLVLALLLSGGQLGAFVTSGWGWAMVFGLLASFAAAIVGFGVNTPTAKRMERLGNSIQGRPPTPAEVQELGTLSQRLTLFSRLSAALLLLAVATMAVARYV